MVKIPVVTSDAETILTTSPQDTRHRHREWATYDSSQKRGRTYFHLTEISAIDHILSSTGRSSSPLGQTTRTSPHHIRGR